MASIGARKHGKFKAVSSAPTINKTPIGNSTPPLPYPVTHDLGNSVGVVPTVRLNNRPAYVLNQTTQPSCKGDAPGSCKGIKSGTVSGEVKPIQGSSTVRVGKKPIIRQGDPCTLNSGNCPGTYVTTETPSTVTAKMAAAAKPASTPVTPAEKSFLDSAADTLKQAGQWYKDNVSESLHDFAGNAMNTGGTISAAGGGTAAVGGVMVATGVGAVPGAVAVAGGGAVAAVGGGVAGVGGIAESAATALDGAADFATSGKLPNLTAMATAYAQRMVMSKIDKLTKLIPGKKGQKKSEQNGGSNDGFKVLGSGGGPCIVGSYNQIKDKCPTGQQAHHIIPDTLNRTSNRAQGAKGIGRIPGMPSLAGGPAICLSGHAKTDGTEHNEAHKGDAEIRDAAKRTDNGPVGTLPVSEAVPIAKQSAINARPECKEQIESEVRKAYPDYENDNRSMNGAGKPAKDDAKAHLESGGSSNETGRTRSKPGKRK